MSSPRELTTLIFEVGRLLRERSSTGLSVSYLHLATLRFIDEKKDPLMRDIAAYLRIAPASATSLVNTLVKQGEVRRVADKNNRRVIRVEVTAKGKKTLTDSASRKHDFIEDLIRNLNPQERVDLQKILQKIIHFKEK